MKSYKSVCINGKQIRTHRFVMEQHLRRKLTSNEIVHHKDGDIFNNDISNLEIVSRSVHIKMHPEIAAKSLKKRYHNIPVNKIKSMYRTMTIQQIAAHFGVAAMTIWYRMKKNNIKTKQRGSWLKIN